MQFGATRAGAFAVSTASTPGGDSGVACGIFLLQRGRAYRQHVRRAHVATGGDDQLLRKALSGGSICVFAGLSGARCGERSGVLAHGVGRGTEIGVLP